MLLSSSHAISKRACVRTRIFFARHLLQTKLVARVVFTTHFIASLKHQFITQKLLFTQVSCGWLQKMILNFS